MECGCSVTGREALEYNVSRPSSLPSRHREGVHTCSLTLQTSIPHWIQKTADLCGPTRERQFQKSVGHVFCLFSEENRTGSQTHCRLSVGLGGSLERVLPSVCRLQNCLLPAFETLLPGTISFLLSEERQI